ncbi:MAG TPA: peptidylprolyl isomerase [Noviherbaspirillum sp.]|jgi:peptidyl-prolyl cis-trans isomerase C|uniref:peptidylprolyl isomerase n=1 Tax=Noviherbaspirillum sp. TaxID=1926288 RepID=UPI002DDDBA04|nr:peptidylprolyl isomerase [Noviherbaspirillum sp.]HEV2611067.1 peptidylprolyl isomerase [Noviherbaspirillum sp.]
MNLDTTSLKRHRGPIAAALLLTAAVLSPAAQAADAPGGPVIATVNGQPITRAVFDQMVNVSIGVANPYDEITPQEKADRKAAEQNIDRIKLLEDLVTMEVLAQKARERGIHLRKEVAAEAELQYKTLLGQQLVRDIIAETKVQQSDIAARYAAQKPERQYQVSHILLKTEAAARSVIAQLDRGNEFASMSRRHSIDTNASKDGSLGWLMTNQMTENFAAAMVKLGAHGMPATSKEPVRTEYGWHVIRVHATRDMPKPPLEAMQNTLRADILRERVEARIAQLKREAKLELKLSQ